MVELAAGPTTDQTLHQGCPSGRRNGQRESPQVHRIGQLDPGKNIHLPTPDGRGFDLSVVQEGFLWKPEEFGPLLFSEDFQVSGLSNLYRGYGLGVPLIGTLVHANKPPTHLFYPKDVNFPVTALFRFEGTLADLGSRRCGKLELVNPLMAQAVSINGQPIPLQADLTTPLAYFLSRTDLNGIEYEGFLSADKLQKRAGIYMFEPYQPGKIPVVMVHGLLSSPLTCAPLKIATAVSPAAKAARTSITPASHCVGWPCWMR